MSAARRTILMWTCAVLATGLSARSEDDPFAGNACVECHRDLPGRLSEIVELEWKQSVHFASGVGCQECHGGNALAQRDRFASDEDWKHAAHLQRDPEFMFMHRSDDRFVSAVRGRSVSYFCGKCHADIKEKHLGSPHGEFGDPTCLYCHGQGSHLITDPALDLIDTRSRAEGGRCSPCHVAATMTSVARIKSLLEETEARIREAGGQYAELQEWGYKNLELDRIQHDAQEMRSGLRQVFHSFNMLEINGYTGEIELAMDRTTATHEMITRLRSAQRGQATVGGLVALMLLVFAGVLVYYRHAFLEPHVPNPAAAEAPPSRIAHRR